MIKLNSNKNNPGFVSPRNSRRTVEGKDYILEAKGKGRKNLLKVNKAANSLLNKREDVQSLMNFGAAVATAAMTNKIGNNKYFKIAEACKSLLGGNSVPVLHHNTRTPNLGRNKGVIKTTKMHVGEPIKGKYAKIPSFHTVNTINLIDTQTDCIDPIRKKETVSRAGLNQRLIDFLDEDTYITVGDMKRITQCDKEIKEQIDRRKDRRTVVTKKNVRSEYQVRIPNLRLNSLIRSVKTKFSINSEIPVYDTYVIVNVCLLKDFNNCSVDIEELKKNIVKEAEDANWLQTGLRKDQIIRDIKKVEGEEDPLRFKRSLIVGVDAVLQKSTTFRESVRIVQSITRVLRDGDRLDLTVTQHFKNGIDLNKLYQIENEHLPASAFLIVEAFGDARGKVIDKNNNLSYNGYSPVEIRYDFKIDVDYTCFHKRKDVPLIVITEEKDKDFDSIDLGDEFYPTREEKFNVNYENLQINGINKNGRYELLLDTKTEQTQGFDRISDLGLNSYLNDRLSEDDIALNANTTDGDGPEITAQELLWNLVMQGKEGSREDYETRHGGNRRENEFEYENYDEDNYGEEDDTIDLDNLE